MTDSRTNYGQQIDNLIRGAYGSKIKVFDQTIPVLSVLRKSVQWAKAFSITTPKVRWQKLPISDEGGAGECRKAA